MIQAFTHPLATLMSDMKKTVRAAGWQLDGSEVMGYLFAPQPNPTMILVPEGSFEIKESVGPVPHSSRDEVPNINHLSLIAEPYGDFYFSPRISLYSREKDILYLYKKESSGIIYRYLVRKDDLILEEGQSDFTYFLLYSKEEGNDDLFLHLLSTD